MTEAADATVRLTDLDRALSGVTPTIIATAAADGTPNVTYLSRVHAVDDRHVALSNQFFSKTSRNLADNPRASVVVFDPVTGDMYRLALRFLRTEREGPVFEQLRSDVEATAAMTGMQDVFRLRAADIYRVERIERLYGDAPRPRDDGAAARRLHAVAELGSRLAASTSLDELVEVVVSGLDELLGHRHVNLMLLDENGTRLYTLASRGFDTQGVGAEVTVGDGVIGMAASQRAPVRVGNLRYMAKYSRSLRRAWESEHNAATPRVPLPRLAGAESRMAAPAMAFGRLIGVLVVDALAHAAFDSDDEAALMAVASLFAPAFEALRAEERTDADTNPAVRDPAPSPPSTGPTPSKDPIQVRHYTADGSTFLDGDYLIKGVAGRILASLLDQHRTDGRVDFTNRELRLDPTLGLPGFKDNLESRLILLSRRLDERAAPIHLNKTGRGQLHLTLDAPIELDVTP